MSIQDFSIRDKSAIVGIGQTAFSKKAEGSEVELAGEAAFEIEAFGKAYRATRGPRTLYDPKMERLRA